MCILWHSWTKWTYLRTETYRAPRYYQGQIVDYYTERRVIERRYCPDCEKFEERVREDYK